MFATINDAPLFYVDEGNPSAMPVLFVHGFPFSHEMWRHQLNVTSQIYRSVAYDIRGHGKSFVGDGQFTINGHVDDLIALLDHLNIQKTVIVGLSMGGYITLRALERSPERFRAAVLCDTRSEGDTDEGRAKRFAGMAGVKKHGSTVFAEAFVGNVFAPDTFVTNPAVVESIRAIIARTPPLSIAGTLLALAARTSTTPSLKNIGIPTLILVGEKDITTPPADARAMHERIAGSELHIIPLAAHMSNLENPAFFNDRLLAFLSRVSAMKP